MPRQDDRGSAAPEVRHLLRERILSGEYAPDQRLVEVDLASRFHASRGAVRSALIDLAAEGLVERTPNCGAKVRVVSLSEAIEITECRMALEGLCAAKAAERITEDEAADLRSLFTGMRSAVDRGDPLGYSDLNHRLHLRIQEIARQRTATLAIERLHGQFVRHQYRLALRPDRPAVSLAEHGQIVDAIISRDPTAAERVMREHLRCVVEALRRDDPEIVDNPPRPFYGQG